VHLHEAQARSEAKDPDNLFVLTRILQEAGANKTVYAFFLTCAKRMTVWRDGLSAKLEKGVEKWRVLET
jgi:hypothetical protein